MLWDHAIFFKKGYLHEEFMAKLHFIDSGEN